MADIKLDVSPVALNLEKLAKEFALEDIAAALRAEAEVVAEASKRLTPVDTGALRASHVVGDPVVDNSSVSVTIGVGGPSAPYAVIVHEVVEYHHPVGQSKFLQTAVSNYARIFAARMALRLRGMFK